MNTKRIAVLAAMLALYACAPNKQIRNPARDFVKPSALECVIEQDTDEHYVTSLKEKTSEISKLLSNGQYDAADKEVRALANWLYRSEIPAAKDHFACVKGFRYNMYVAIETRSQETSYGSLKADAAGFAVMVAGTPVAMAFDIVKYPFCLDAKMTPYCQESMAGSWLKTGTNARETEKLKATEYNKIRVNPAFGERETLKRGMSYEEVTADMRK